MKLDNSLPTVMMIGETGAGKSFLGNALLGEIFPNKCKCKVGRRRKSECCPFEAAKAGNVKGL